MHILYREMGISFLIRKVLIIGKQNKLYPVIMENLFLLHMCLSFYAERMLFRQFQIYLAWLHALNFLKLTLSFNFCCAYWVRQTVLQLHLLANQVFKIFRLTILISLYPESIMCYTVITSRNHQDIALTLKTSIPSYNFTAFLGNIFQCLQMLTISN